MARKQHNKLYQKVCVWDGREHQGFKGTIYKQKEGRKAGLVLNMQTKLSRHIFWGSNAVPYFCDT